MHLVRIEHEFLNSNDFDLGYWWLDGLQYECADATSDHQVLAALLADGWYRHDYASHRGVQSDRGVPNIHGPYAIEHITPEVFVGRTRPEALETLDAWMRVIEPTPEFDRRYRSMCDRFLPVGHRLYQLPDLGEDKWHEYGFVVGADGGFNEFIAISPDLRSVSVLVATDD